MFDVFSKLFQFLYGAIKTLDCVQYKLVVPSFQFLYGAIKTRLCSFFYSVLYLVSIPLWCD